MADRVPSVPVDDVAAELAPGESFAIGEVANRLGVSIDALRYYEAEGLLGDVERDAGGRRRFTHRSLYAVAVVAAGQRRASGSTMPRWEPCLRL
ncbi:MAG: MerR family DNA-binding transcriptional regulator [Propionibacteriaceae bacterium]|nr:MerR family DNA-binding transcriptional regulator [Propionibacteriaceae bacterium]